MSCRYMAGTFDLPIKYGYCLVGTGIEGTLADKRVFVMHPHQDHVLIEDHHAIPLPDPLPSHRATLIPNTETALNGVWDAEIQQGETSIIVGGGLVGLLVAFVLRRLDLGSTTVVDVDPQRLEAIARFPFVDRALSTTELEPDSCSLAFHTTGTADGLRSALESMGFEGRVIDLSWYGDRPVSLQLGTHFHHERKRLISSQVGTIAPLRRGSTSLADRLAEVVDLLQDTAVDDLLGSPIPFESLPILMRELYAGNTRDFLPLVQYPTQSA